MAERRSRSWWKQAVARWKRSGLTASEFAAREGVSARTLSWWTSTLRRGTRAARGSGEGAVAPIEIELPRARSGGDAYLEIAVGGAVIRVEVGADVDYVAALVRRLEAAR
jgi:transposase-like protein